MFITDFSGICKFFENAESTVKQKFKRKQEQYGQLGIPVKKNGRGKAANYSVTVDWAIVKELTDMEYSKEIKCLDDIKELKSWIMENSEFCYCCKKWINKREATWIAIPSASGQSEIACKCCDTCLEEGYHAYML